MQATQLFGIELQNLSWPSSFYESSLPVLKPGKGPSIKYVTLFWPILTPPLPSVTLCHTTRDPPKVRHTFLTPPFLVGLVKKTRTKAPFTNSLSIVRGGFCPGVFLGVFFL